MTLVILSYLLGFDRKVRQGIWALLFTMVLAVGSAAFIHGIKASSPQAFAATDDDGTQEILDMLGLDLGIDDEDEDESESTTTTHTSSYQQGTVVWYLEKLLTLKEEYEPTGMFDGRNEEFIELIIDDIEDKDPAMQASHLESVKETLEAMDESESKNKRGLNAEPLIITFAEILENAITELEVETTEATEAEHGSTTSNKSKAVQDPETISKAFDYTVYTTKSDQTIVVFEFVGTRIPRRMNVHFGDGTRYSCERNQCKRFYHMYTKEKDYKLAVFTTITSRKGWHDMVTFNPWDNDMTDEDEKDTKKTSTKTSTTTTSTGTNTGTTTDTEDMTDDDLDSIKDFLGLDL